MTLRPCSRQAEVLALQARGHWPHACPPDLSAHLEDCRSCAELLWLRQAFAQQRAITAAQAKLPAAGAVWWRAQLRRRHAAVASIGKPILGAYVFACVLTVLAAAVFTVSQARHGLRWLDWLNTAGSEVHAQAGLLTAVNPGFGLPWLIVLFATLVLIGALVVYLAGERQ